jgi:hypothetical protein
VRLRIDKLSSIRESSTFTEGKVIHDLGDIRTLTQAQIDSIELTDAERAHAKYKLTRAMLEVKSLSPQPDNLRKDLKRCAVHFICRSDGQCIVEGSPKCAYCESDECFKTLPTPPHSGDATVYN